MKILAIGQGLLPQPTDWHMPYPATFSALDSMPYFDDYQMFSTGMINVAAERDYIPFGMGMGEFLP